MEHIEVTGLCGRPSVTAPSWRPMWIAKSGSPKKGSATEGDRDKLRWGDLTRTNSACAP